MADWYEVIIIGVILAGIATAIFRGGQANPEGTASLRSTIGRIDQRLKAVETEVKHAASVQDVATIRAEMAGDRALANDTKRAIDRIEGYLIERGLGGRS